LTDYEKKSKFNYQKQTKGDFKTMEEKIKKHLIKMVSGIDYDKIIKERFEYFKYLKQPKKIADAIARTL